ncbi:MAG: hypothetical protein DCC66_07845 [Planctomycetota bacterium]|nr:MAG: hypothetical protein DCC66_07845 [Planctomycetota bacterium]
MVALRGASTARQSPYWLVDFAFADKAYNSGTNQGVSELTQGRGENRMGLGFRTVAGWNRPAPDKMCGGQTIVRP